MSSKCLTKSLIVLLFVDIVYTFVDLALLRLIITLFLIPNLIYINIVKSFVNNYNSAYRTSFDRYFIRSTLLISYKIWTSYDRLKLPSICTAEARDWSTTLRKSTEAEGKRVENAGATCIRVSEPVNGAKLAKRGF